MSFFLKYLGLGKTKVKPKFSQAYKSDAKTTKSSVSTKHNLQTQRSLN